jgi:hypothetical protein
MHPEGHGGHKPAGGHKKGALLAKLGLHKNEEHATEASTEEVEQGSVEPTETATAASSDPPDRGDETDDVDEVIKRRFPPVPSSAPPASAGTTSTGEED